MDVRVNPQWAQLCGWKSTQAAQPAKNIHKRAIGKEIKRHLFVRTGCTNLSGKNMETANAVTNAILIQKFGERANRTITSMFQHPGKPLKLLSLVFISVSQK